MPRVWREQPVSCDTSSGRADVPGSDLLLWESFDMSAVTAVDLFSGAGGASLGLIGGGFDLRLAADLTPHAG